MIFRSGLVIYIEVGLVVLEVDLVVLEDALLVLDDIFEVINSFFLDLEVDFEFDVLQIEDVVFDDDFEVVALVLRLDAFGLS